MYVYHTDRNGEFNLGWVCEFQLTISVFDCSFFLFKMYQTSKQCTCLSTTCSSLWVLHSLAAFLL